MWTINGSAKVDLIFTWWTVTDLGVGTERSKMVYKKYGIKDFSFLQWSNQGFFFNILFMKGLASRCYKKPMKFIQGAFGSFFNARIVFKKDRWRWVLCTYVYIYKINGWYLFASLLVVGVYNLCCILRTRTFFSHHNSSQHDLNLGRDDNGSMFYPWGDDALWRTLVFKWLESTNYKWFLS